MVTVWPASSGAVSYTLPWNLIVAVRAATVRMASHKNAASSSAAPVNRGVPALHRASGVTPGRGVDPHVVLVPGPGGEPAVELLQAGRHPAAGGGLAGGGDLDQELPPHRLEEPSAPAAPLELTGQSQLILWITS